MKKLLLGLLVFSCFFLQTTEGYTAFDDTKPAQTQTVSAGMQSTRDNFEAISGTDGSLPALQVDNVNINGNTISSTAGTDLIITPLAGQQIVLDGTIVIDAGVVTGATSITSTGFTGALTGNADTVTTNANLTGEVTSVGNAATIADSIAVTSWNLTTPTITTSLTTSTPTTLTAAELDRLDGLAGIIVTDGTACTDLEGTNLSITAGVLNASASGNETLAQTLAIGADANDLAITSLAKLEGVDPQVYVDLGQNGQVILEADTSVDITSPLNVTGAANIIGTTTLGTATSVAGNLTLYDEGLLTLYENGDNFSVTMDCQDGEAVMDLQGGLDVSGVITSTSPVFTTPDLGTPSALVGTNISGTASGLTAGAVTNATLTTVLTVNTGTVTLTGNVANNSVLTIGAGAVSVSGANTGDNTVCTSGTATTAATLATTRAIGGVNFDGSAAITPTTIAVTDESADTSCYMAYFTDATGNLLPKTGTNATFNSSTGVLTATGFAGALTGNVTGDVSGSSGSCTGNAATATTATTANSGDSATSFFATGTLATGIGGTGATAAANAANGVAVLGADGYLANDLVDTTALKTATSEHSAIGTVWENEAVTGGAYCFWPQVKTSVAGADGEVISHTYRAGAVGNVSTSYGARVTIYAGTNTWYALFTYITASGSDYWIWLKIDKNTKELISAQAAPDHPSYGNGGDPEKTPHPFGNYDETKHEIILLDKDTCKYLQEESKATGKSILTLVNEEYKPDMTEIKEYKPLHSGKFLGQVPVMIETIPDYIKVRKLEKLTNKDKQDREIKHQQIETERLQLEQLKKAKVNQLKGKLGLSDEEYNLLTEKIDK